MESIATRKRLGAGARDTLIKRLTHIVDHMRPAAIEGALAEDDVGTLVDVVTQDLWNDEALTGLDRARLRGLKYRRELLSNAHGTFGVSEAADTLGVTPQAVRKRIQQRKLIAIECQGGYQIPAVQIRGGRFLPGLSRVLNALPVTSAWTQLDWLMTPEPRLGDQRPLDALSGGGNIDEIMAAAAMVGEHGAA